MMVKLVNLERSNNGIAFSYYPMPIRKFWEVRNKILVIRRLGGMGDVVMHRFMFEDLKAMHPEFKISFACPPQFHDFVDDHPFIDEVLDSSKVDLREFIISFDTTRCCICTEFSTSPDVVQNRPDIWAEWCGVKIKNYDMHFNLSEETIKFGRDKIHELNPKDKPTVLFCPLSVSKDRSISDDKIEQVTKNLRDMGYFVISLHHLPVSIFNRIGVPVLKLKPKELIGLVNASDYVISVDTGPLHIAGGLRKPLVGIFTWVDGKIRGNHYDMILVQKHKDEGWKCGPCWRPCPRSREEYLPCSTEITMDMIMAGINKMFEKWKR